MQSVIKLAIAVVVFVGTYFFSTQLQKGVMRIVHKFGEKIGVFSVDREYSIQRYIFLHRGSFIAKRYDWLNEQIINLGLKRYGITPIGYLCFWSLICIPLTLVVGILLSVSVLSFIGLYLILFFAILLLTRVYVAEKMEKREAMIMNAEDLIIPDIKNGTQNAIMRYRGNFDAEIRPEFDAFLANIVDRGYSFTSAMYVLSDALGSIFREFAQKAIYYENLGEEDMADIFQDIVETNRQRRDLRYDNNKVFNELRVSFTLSSSLTAIYGVFVITTDKFSRHFFLETGAGKMLLLLMVLIIIGVLSYNTTIKSKAI